VRERREVAARTHASLLRHHRVDAPREHGEEQLASSGRAPECPRASTLARSSIIARTSRVGSGGPTPAAWLRTRLRCRSRRRPGAMATSDNLPKPVVTPYTTAPPATRPSTTARVSAMCARAAGASAGGAPPSATRRSAARVSARPSSAGAPAAGPLPPAGLTAWPGSSAG
jgi:hypothetical protein